MPGNWGETCKLTVEFQSMNKVETIMALFHEGVPAEVHDDCIESWTTSLDKLQALVEKN